MSSVPRCITAADIATAADVIAGHALRTPVMTSRQADQIAGAQLFFKCENFQRIGAFKFRGAYNAIAQLSAEQRRAGVIAFSSGNHAQAMALAARELGVSATIVMPDDAPAAKLAATRGYGANVVIYQRHSEDREEITRRLAAERGLTLVPPYDYPQVIAGQAPPPRSCLKRPGHWICCWYAPAAAVCWPAARWRRITGRRAAACSASSPKPATTFSKPFSAVNRCTSRCRKPLPTARRPNRSGG